jgi:hypothetical protein
MRTKESPENPCTCEEAGGAHGRASDSHELTPWSDRD